MISLREIEIQIGNLLEAQEEINDMVHTWNHSDNEHNRAVCDPSDIYVKEQEIEELRKDLHKLMREYLTEQKD